MRNARTNEYLVDVGDRLEKLRALGEAAVAQVDDRALFRTLDEESNSIAVLLKHLAGNMQTRWDGFPQEGESESPGRNRDSEFEIDTGDTKRELLSKWEAGWQCTFDMLERLTEDDVNKVVLLRGEPMSVMSAINRQFTHYAYHVGQIVLLAKHYCSGEWHPLSIPRGKSDEFARNRGAS